MKKILILAANPKDTSHLRLDEEVRDIKEALKRSDLRNQFTVEQQWATRPLDLRRALLSVKPQIVHFCGHGEGKAGLALEDNAGKAKLVSTEALSDLFEIFAGTTKCVLLNACYAKEQAEAIVYHIDYVIGMNQAIKDTAAIAFSVGFYDALGAGEPIEIAYKLGCNAIRFEVDTYAKPSRKANVVYTVEDTPTTQMAEHLIPVLLKKSDLHQSIETLERENAITIETLQATAEAGENRIAQLEEGIESIQQTIQLEQTLKKALEWLEKRQSLAQKASEHVFQTVTTTQSWSEDKQDDFCWEIEKYLEFLYYSLQTGMDDLLDEPPIEPTCDHPLAYREAFSFIKGRILPSIDPNIANKIREKLDYLYSRLF